MFDFLCEDCGKGTIRKRTIQNLATKIRGYPYVVPAAVVGVCDNCGAQVFDPVELRRWDKLFTAELEQKGDLLTSQQIRSIREDMGLSIADFAKLIGATRQSVYNWEGEDRKAPQIRLVDLLIRLIRESRASGRVDVLAFLQEQAKAAGGAVTIKLASNISTGRAESAFELAPANRFDQLYHSGEAPVALPALRC
jgi:putative zinc finger/helix-turn-helix YgiT family protein